MRRAVALLPEDTAWKCRDGCTWRQLGRLLYFGSEVDAALQSYKDYRAAAREYTGVTWSERDFGRLPLYVRNRLADILLDMEREATAVRTVAWAAGAIVSKAVLDDDAPPFTPRPVIAKRLEEALRAQDDDPTMPRRVFLIGEAGTGKTRFIREYTAAKNPVWIDAGADEAMLPGLTDTLTAYGVDVARLDTPRIKHDFKQLLGRPDGPRLVVLDDVPNTAQLDQLVPKSARSRVLVTSRRWPGNKASVIRIDDLDLEEATAMAATLLPGFSTKDCASLAAAFGCRPLLIEHACRYIREVGVTDIPDYCEGVRQDVAEIIGAAADIADSTDQTLTVIYTNYVRQLEQQAPRSVQLLELLTFVAHCNVPAETAMSYLLRVPLITPDLLTRAQVAYDAALKPLLAYSLVSFRPGNGTSMQPLTQHVLRGIFQDRLLAILQRALPLMDLPAPSHGSLFEAGWHIFSFAGRLTCRNVLIVHARELYPERDTSPLYGVVGSVQWTLLVEKLWGRNCELSMIIWFMYLFTTMGERDSSDYITWESDGDFKKLIDPAQSEQAIQRDELAAVREIIGKLSFRTFTGHSVEDYSAWNEDGVARFAFTLREAITRVGRRYEDSPLGTLDLGVFFRDWEERIAQAGTELGSGVAAPIRSGSPAAERFAAMSHEERYESLLELVRQRKRMSEASRRDEKEQVDGDASSVPRAIPQQQEE
jgi:hypothetical protein